MPFANVSGRLQASVVFRKCVSIDVSVDFTFGDFVALCIMIFQIIELNLIFCYRYFITFYISDYNRHQLKSFRYQIDNADTQTPFLNKVIDPNSLTSCQNS